MPEQIRYTSFFTNNKSLLLRGQINLETDPLKMILLSSGYTLNLAHQQLSDVAAYELPTANGYTQGGLALANRSLAVDLVNKLVVLKADNPQWDITGTILSRYQATYLLGTYGGLINPLISISYILSEGVYVDSGATNSKYTIILTDGNLLRI